MTNKCKTCDMNCSDTCTEEENYKPEAILAWLGVAVMAWCAFFLWLVLL